MLTPDDPEFREFGDEFARLLAEEGLDDLSQFLTAETFEEVPLFSRYAQIDFLGDLDTARRNILTIRFAVAHLGSIQRYARERRAAAPGRQPDPCLRMVTVTDWWDYGDDGVEYNNGTRDVLSPHFWVGDLGSPKMAAFRMHPPDSAYSAFVRSALEGVPSVALHEGWSSDDRDRLLSRVYIELTG
jgi:hypothetical protein